MRGNVRVTACWWLVPYSTRLDVFKLTAMKLGQVSSSHRNVQALTPICFTGPATQL